VSPLTFLLINWRSLSYNRLTELSIDSAGLVSLTSLLLANNSITAVDPAVWQPMLISGFNLLDMSGNPSQCFTGLDSSDLLTLSVVCECGAGYVGKAAASGQLASGCVARRKSIVQPPSAAVIGSTYVFAVPNASVVIPSLCASTSPVPCCSASQVSSTSVSVQVSSAAPCPLISNWSITSLPSSNAFYVSASVAQQVADGFFNLPQLQTVNVSQQGTFNQTFVVSFANSSFAPNLLFPSQIVYQFNSSSTALPGGLTLDTSSGAIGGVPQYPSPPVQYQLFINNTVLNYSTLFAVVSVSVVECNDVSCSSHGACDFDGSPYDGMFLCMCSAGFWGVLCQHAKPCPVGLLGPGCQYADPFTGTNDDAAISIGTLAAVGLMVLVVWWSRSQDDKQRLSSRLYETHVQLHETQAEISSMQRLWQIPVGELVMQADIAAGSFGRVVRALWNDIPVAVKCLSGALMSLDEAAVADFERECAFMKSVRHGNIILFYGAGRLEDGTPFLVLELSERGSLCSMLEKATTAAEVIAWERKLVFAKDTALGMQHLHSLGCIHRDLKSGNLLVTQNYHIKVADFGTSKLAASLQANPLYEGDTNEVGNGTRTMTKMVGTPLWMAPELLEGKKSYDNKVDVYAYGIVLFEILTQTLPWTELPAAFFLNRLSEAVLSGKRPAMPEEGVVCPDERFLGLMEQCWAQQGKDRPTFKDVVGSLVFAGRPALPV
jgi:hypothetical protein